MRDSPHASGAGSGHCRAVAAASVPRAGSGRRRETPGLALVDVRKPGELADGAIPDAVHIPLTALVARLGELDPARPTVVYCASGYRSMIAASVLRSAGFADVSDLLGGFTAWAAATVDA